MLINTSTNLSYEEFRGELEYVAVGNHDLIKDPKDVANYVTKYFGVYDIDYDILFKEDKTRREVHKTLKLLSILLTQ